MQLFFTWDGSTMITTATEHDSGHEQAETEHDRGHEQAEMVWLRLQLNKLLKPFCKGEKDDFVDDFVNDLVNDFENGFVNTKVNNSLNVKIWP